MRAFNFGHHILNDTFLALSSFSLLSFTWVYVKCTHLINHDTGWYLHSAQAFLNGGTLYQDIFWEVNPPLAFFLTLPPVWLGMASGGFIIPYFIFYVFTLIFLSLLLSNTVLRNFENVSLANRRICILFMFIALAVSPAGDFGQREHFLMILTMPYIVYIVLQISGKALLTLPLKVIIGFLGGIGFAMKPHFLVVPVILEFLLFLKTRQPRNHIRSETITLSTTLGLYGLFVYFLTPEYVRTVVPYALMVYNTAYKNDLLLVLFRAETIQLPVIIILHFVTRSKQRYPLFSDLFLSLALVFYCIYFIQMKGWHYHIYPVSTMLLMTITTMTLGLVPTTFSPRDFNKTRHATKGQIILLSGLLILMTLNPLRQGGYTNSFMAQAAPLVEQYAKGRPIYIFSSNVWTGFPLINYTQAQWSSRFPTLWLIPGLTQARYKLESNLTAHDTRLLDEIERFSKEAVIADLTDTPPNLIIVDNRKDKSYFGNIDFDYITYFSSDPKFSLLWQHYKHITDIREFAVYQRI